jgi:hypothetical protein
VHDLDPCRTQRDEQLAFDVRLGDGAEMAGRGTEIEQRRDVGPAQQDLAQSDGLGLEPEDRNPFRRRTVKLEERWYPFGAIPL